MGSEGNRTDMTKEINFKTYSSWKYPFCRDTYFLNVLCNLPKLPKLFHIICVSQNFKNLFDNLSGGLILIHCLQRWRQYLTPINFFSWNAGNAEKYLSF